MRTRGYIDGLFGDTVRGWVVDLDDPATPLRVAVRFDGIAHPVAEAGEPREDLARAGIGAGIGGFRVHLGLTPTSGAHEIVALIDGTTIAVPLATDSRVLGADGELRADLDLYEERDPAPIVAPSLPAEAPDELVAGQAEVAAVPVTGPPAARGDALLAGENGWLFACPGEGFELLRGVARPARGTIDSLLGTLLALDAEATAAGSRLIIAVVPDKLFVYPEHLPATMPVLPVGRLAEHLSARAQDDDRLRLLDLLPTLLRARVHGRMFNRAGAAPTWLGAFHSYRAVAKSIAPALPAMAPCPVAAVRLGPERPVSDLPPASEVFAWQGTGLKAQRRPAPAAGALEASMVGFAAPDAGERPSVLVVHDAATPRVAELLAAHGDPASLVQADRVAPGLVEAQRPEALVWLLSDLTLVGLASATGSAAGATPS